MRIVHNSVLVVLVAAAGAHAQRTYTANPVQAPGFALSSLVWLSDDGRVGYGSGLSQSANGNTISECLRYQDGLFTIVSRTDSFCSAAGGNDRGQFVGALSVPDGSSTAAFVYDDGRYIRLSRFLPDQTQVSIAQGINRQGDIAGFYYANPQTIGYTGAGSQVSTVTQYQNQYAFVFLNRQFIQLPTLGGANTQAVAINANGDAAGTADLQTGQTHAVLFPRTGGIMDLGTLGGNYSRAVSINSLGQIAGESTLTADQRDTTYHSFFYDGSAMRAIQLPGVDSRSVWINDNGEIVGVYRGADYLDHPYYYVNGNASDLNSQVANPPPGMVLTTPQFINNQGQILVMGVLGQTPVQFLLTPISN